MTQVTATSMEGLLVSKNLSGCGFVYGSLSFMDKLACGIALYLIEGMNGNISFLHGPLCVLVLSQISDLFSQCFTLTKVGAT